MCSPAHPATPARWRHRGARSISPHARFARGANAQSFELFREDSVSSSVVSQGKYSGDGSREASPQPGQRRKLISSAASFSFGRPNAPPHAAAAPVPSMVRAASLVNLQQHRPLLEADSSDASTADEAEMPRAPSAVLGGALGFPAACGAPAGAEVRDSVSPPALEARRSRYARPHPPANPQGGAPPRALAAAARGGGGTHFRIIYSLFIYLFIYLWGFAFLDRRPHEEEADAPRGEADARGGAAGAGRRASRADSPTPEERRKEVSTAEEERGLRRPPAPAPAKRLPPPLLWGDAGEHVAAPAAPEVPAAPLSARALDVGSAGAPSQELAALDLNPRGAGGPGTPLARQGGVVRERSTDALDLAGLGLGAIAGDEPPAEGAGGRRDSLPAAPAGGAGGGWWGLGGGLLSVLQRRPSAPAAHSPAGFVPEEARLASGAAAGAGAPAPPAGKGSGGVSDPLRGILRSLSSKHVDWLATVATTPVHAARETASHAREQLERLASSAAHGGGAVAQGAVNGAVHGAKGAVHGAVGAAATAVGAAAHVSHGAVQGAVDGAKGAVHGAVGVAATATAVGVGAAATAVGAASHVSHAAYEGASLVKDHVAERAKVRLGQAAHGAQTLTAAASQLAESLPAREARDKLAWLAGHHAPAAMQVREALLRRADAPRPRRASEGQRDQGLPGGAVCPRPAPPPPSPLRAKPAACACPVDQTAPVLEGFEAEAGPWTKLPRPGPRGAG